jgi:hypothetical protein
MKMNAIEIIREKLIRDLYPIIHSEENDLRRNIYQKLDFVKKNVDNKKCLIPGCTQNTIRSHELSKASILKTFGDSKYVYVISKNYANDMNKRKLTKKGKVSATTFPGFCKMHDATLFLDVDNVDFEITDRYVNELFFRTLAKEYCKLITSEKLFTYIDSKECLENVVDKNLFSEMISILLEIDKKLKDKIYSFDKTKLLKLFFTKKYQKLIQKEDTLNKKTHLINENLNTVYFAIKEYCEVFLSRYSLKEIEKIYNKSYKKIDANSLHIYYAVYKVDSILLFSYIDKNYFGITYEIHVFNKNEYYYLIISSNSRFYIREIVKQKKEFIEKYINHIIYSNYNNIILPFGEAIASDFNISCILDSNSYTKLNECIKMVKVKQLTKSST